MPVLTTPLSYLNTQVVELSTTVDTLDVAFTYFSTTVFPTVSTLASGAYSTAQQVLSTTANFVSNYETFSTNQSTTNAALFNVSTYVGTTLPLVSTAVQTALSSGTVTSTSLGQFASTTTSTINALLTVTAAFTTFSTLTFTLFSTGISTIDGRQQSTLNVISTIDGQQSSTINVVSTLAGQAVSTVNTVSTLAGQSASTVNAQSTINGTQTASINLLTASTATLQYGARQFQAFNGVYADTDFGSGVNANKSSTIMRFQAGLDANGAGSVGSSNSVSLINNTTNTETVRLPLYLTTTGSNIPAYPAIANQILRFAHSGVPGTNSSIIINLYDGTAANDAIEMNAGEVVTLVYNTGSTSNPTSYYYFPTL